MLYNDSTYYPPFFESLLPSSTFLLRSLCLRLVFRAAVGTLLSRLTVRDFLARIADSFLAISSARFISSRSFF
jgi:hypothetical protein